jgi:hypothetical protein
MSSLVIAVSVLSVLSRFIVDMSAPVAVFRFGDWLR